MRPYYEDEKAGIVIYHGDCREVLPGLDAPDLVFTSPPYLNQRSYELESFDWYAVVPPALASVPDHGHTQLLINLGQLHGANGINRYWITLADHMERSGWRWWGLYPWDQGSGLPGKFGGRFAPSHELLLHFNRDWIALRKTIPVKTENIGKRGGSSGRLGNRSCGVDRGKFSICGDSMKIADSVVRVRRKVGDGGHPAVFPLKLATHCIAPFPGSVIDPFMGSGTTLRAAKDLGRKAIGIEIEERYCEIAARRLAQEVLF